jgi:hypothetical protein
MGKSRKVKEADPRGLSCRGKGWVVNPWKWQAQFGASIGEKVK